MKLSEYKNEDALDLLADLIEPASAIMTDGKMRDMISKGVSRLDLAKYLLKEHQKEIIAVLARVNGETTYEANVVEILKQVLDLINDPILVDFFVSQAQSTAGAISMPVTENITETEKA